MGSLREKIKESVVTKEERNLEERVNSGIINLLEGKEAIVGIIGMWVQALGNPSIS